MGWLGRGRRHFYKTEPTAAIEGKVLKSDSAPETTFFADKAQSVAGLLDKFKS